MLTLLFLYRRAPWPLKILGLAVLFIVALTTFARVFKATHQIQERQQHVHARRSDR